jgi:hypothetical protein
MRCHAIGPGILKRLKPALRSVMPASVFKTSRAEHAGCRAASHENVASLKRARSRKDSPISWLPHCNNLDICAWW